MQGFVNDNVVLFNANLTLGTDKSHGTKSNTDMLYMAKNGLRLCS